MKPLAQNTLIQNRYLIVHLIGKGGMGEVYLAVDQRLGSAVALKRTFFAGDEMLSNAFEREARILARMRHPVLPKVSDHFSEGDEQYLVMEHISGDDLSKRLEAAGKPFPLSWVMFWADQLLDALSYLHSHEPPIIHRDIKPQNLKLTDENHVILLDFGLSKNSTGQTKITDSGGSTGSVVGYTPHYAPMEQIRGIGTSPKSDIYSLSATLYQLLTGVVPPDALSRADTMLNGSPDPIEQLNRVNPEIPLAVSAVILNGMEVSQDKRFTNARDMQKALRKAHAQMQGEMAASTVVMTSAGTTQTDSVPVSAPSMEKTEVMDFAAVMSVPNQLSGAQLKSEAPTNLVSNPNSRPAFDPNATVAFDMPATPSLPRQTDVKTEVFLSGGSSFPTPAEPTPIVPDLPLANADFGMTEDYRAGSNGDAFNQASFTPDATTPIIALDEGVGVSEATAAGENFYTSPYVGNEEAANDFESAENNFDEQEYRAQEAAFVPAAPVVAAKRKSNGKVFAILGGLFALFILGAAASVGGWYLYTNYYAAAAVEPEASPSPSVEPSPEPTIDFASSNVNDNTNVDTADSSNSNTNGSDELTVAPTPSPGAEPTPGETAIATRPTTPGRDKPARNPATKPTPKPKTTTTRDRQKILQ